MSESIYMACCQKCESADLMYDYKTEIYTCNNCGEKLSWSQWRAIVKADIETTFIEMLPTRRQSIFNKAIDPDLPTFLGGPEK